MKWKSTLVLLVLVVGFGGALWFLEREGSGTEERAEEARRALRIDPDAVTALRIQSTNYVLSCHRDRESWMIDEPIQAHADNGRIKQILVGLHNLPKGEVVTERDREVNGLRLHDYGLALPRATIQMRQDNSIRTILVGGSSPMGDAVYLMESNRSSIVTTSPDIWNIIPEDVSTVRSRKLLHGASLALKRIEIRRAAGFLQIGLTEEGVWMLQQPLVGRAGPMFVRDLAAKLIHADIEEFVEDHVSDFSPYGLDDPSVVVTLWPAADAGTYAVSLGDPLEDDPDLLYARTADSDSVYAVSKQLRADLNLDAGILRDRRLLHIQAERVSYFQVREGEQTLELQRDAAGSWSLVKPVQRPAEAALASSLIGAWAQTRIEEFVSNAATNNEGLAEAGPFRTIVLATRAPVIPESDAQPLEEGKNKVTLELFRIPDRADRIYATIPHEDAVYETAAGLLRDATLDPLVYYDREVLRLRPEDIRTLDVRRGESRHAAVLDEAGRFRPANAGAAELLQDVVDNILRDMNPLRVERYVAENPSDLAAYGLADSTDAITLGLTSEAGISKTLLFGSDTEPDGVFATIRGQGTVFVLARDLRDRLLSDFLVRPPSSQKDSSVQTDTNALVP